MQTPDEESLRARIRRADDQLTEAAAALDSLEEAAGAGSAHTIIAATAEDIDGEDGTVYRVPTPYILHAVRQWQKAARVEKIAAEKLLEGLR